MIKVYLSCPSGLNSKPKYERERKMIKDFVSKRNMTVFDPLESKKVRKRWLKAKQKYLRNGKLKKYIEISKEYVDTMMKEIYSSQIFLAYIPQVSMGLAFEMMYAFLNQKHIVAIVEWDYHHGWIYAIANEIYPDIITWMNTWKIKNVGWL